MNAPTYYLLIDTETTGKLVKGAAVDDPRQPHPVQFAGLLVQRPDLVISALDCLLKCPVAIQPEATAIHHITDEQCATLGLSFAQWHSWWQFATYFPALTIIGHNIAFDKTIVDVYLRRNGCIDDAINLVIQPTRCTMQESTQHCKLPGRYGDYKWPKLSEAYKHFTGLDLPGAHDAMTDLMATLTVLNHLDRLNQPTP